MGLDISIRPDEKYIGHYYDNVVVSFDDIWLNGRMTYSELVFDIVGIKDEQYGKYVPISKEMATEVVHYLLSRDEYAAQKLALWIVLDIPIEFEADW